MDKIARSECVIVYVCQSCDARVPETTAHPEMEHIITRRLREAMPDTFPPEQGPRQLYHTVVGWEYLGHSGSCGASVPYERECGPLEPETLQDRYVEMALKGV